MVEEPAQKAEKPQEITMADLLSALQQELRFTNERIRHLEQRQARFDRIFESAFRDEAQRRLGITSATDEMSAKVCQMGPLAELEWRMKH